MGWYRSSLRNLVRSHGFPLWGEAIPKQFAGQTYPPLAHRPASVFEARGSVHKAWISLALRTSNAAG